MDKEKYKLYEIGDEYIWVREGEEVYPGYRELSEEEKRDISFLITKEYLDYFINPKQECKGETTGYLGSWKYPSIMKKFKVDVLKAFTLANGPKRDKSIWAEMRNKYFDGKPYVYPEEMIENLFKFDNKEIIAFLWFCSCYKERFIDGVYGEYASEGLVGKILKRLEELPHEIEI